jgi:GntR family transcriptional regulator
MIRATEKVKAVIADTDSARLLSVELGTPLLSVERVSFSYGDRPIEVRRSLYLTAAHHYQNELG